MGLQLIGPIEPGDFRSVDFTTLETYEFRKRAEPVMEALEAIIPSVSEKDRSVMLLPCILMSYSRGIRASYGHLISMSSSVISAIQLPDPSETGLFDKPPRPRQQSYHLLDSEYTYGFYSLCSKFT